jgi:hypothetical protein
MDKLQRGRVNAIAQAAAIRRAIRKNVPKVAVAMRTFRLAPCGLFGNQSATASRDFEKNR